MREGVGAATSFIEQQVEAGLLDGGVARCHATTRKGKACQRTPLPGPRLLPVPPASRASSPRVPSAPRRSGCRPATFSDVAPTLIVLATLQFPEALLVSAGLSFLGLGAQPPLPEWGALLTSARVYLTRAPWLVNFPGLAILVTVLGLNLLGNALRDVLDPRLK